MHKQRPPIHARREETMENKYFQRLPITMKIRFMAILCLILVCSGCQGISLTSSVDDKTTVIPSPTPTQSLSHLKRTLLTSDALTNGFSFDGPVDESALTPPEDAAPAAHIFAGRLELIGEKEQSNAGITR